METISPLKIRDDTFVVVSKYAGDADWIKEYTSNYQIYDKSDPVPNYPDANLLGYRDIRIPNVGYNLYAYFTYIIEHYENLPERLMLIKNNVIGRHVSKEYFESVMNNDFFTSIVDHKLLSFKMPDAYWDGNYMERNGLNMYFDVLYVSNPNKFFDFVYSNPHRPTYIRFCPGANYIVPKGQILRLPKILYQHMRTMVEHSRLSGESHIIERCLDTLWTSGLPIKENLKIPNL
jgi:hypothetical protein